MKSFVHGGLTVAWITDFPVEWLQDIPNELAGLPKGHPRTWQQVLLQQLETHSQINLHVLVLRKTVKRNVKFIRNGVTFHVLKVPRAVREQTIYWADTLIIRRALKSVKPDLVQAWGTERGAHVVAKRLGYPYLVTIQGLMSWYKEIVPLNFYERFAAFLEKTNLAAAPLVTTESRFALEYLKEKFPGLRVLQAEHAPNPVFQRVVRNPQKAPLRFVFVGHLDYRKGGDLLLTALEKLENNAQFELYVLGSIADTFSSRLETLRRRPAWKGFRLRSGLSASEIAEELSKATMLLFPTRADTSPNAVKEAVVAGVPVIGSAVGGIVDYVIPDKNGLLFNSDNVVQFTAQLQQAIHHPLFSAGMVDADALSKARSYLSVQNMANRFIEAYEIATRRRGMPEDPRLPFK
jgi:glycosyltransferase involved in cell wall biosynthesis